VPEEVEKWFTQTVEQAKLYGTPWSPDTHQRIEELEERVREVEASQQLLLRAVSVKWWKISEGIIQHS